MPAWRYGDVELAADLRECWTADAIAARETLHRLTPDRLVKLITVQDHGVSVHAWIESQRAAPGWTVPPPRLVRASTMEGMTFAKSGSGRTAPRPRKDLARKTVDTGSNTDPFFFRRSPERLVCGTCGKVTRARWAVVLQGWYSGPNGAYYCSSPCIPRLPDGKRNPRRYYVRMSVQDASTADDLDRWAAWARRRFFEILNSSKDDHNTAGPRQLEQVSRLRERAARMEREAERLRSEAARLKREAELVAGPVPPVPGASSGGPRRGDTRKR